MTYQLILGDCIEGMRAMADKSVDVVCSDPPYSGACAQERPDHGRNVSR